MLTPLIITLLGAVLGALLGSTRQCRTGACPLTASPVRGALCGAFLGGIIGFAPLLRRSDPGAGGDPMKLAPKRSVPPSPNIVRVSDAGAFEEQVEKASGVVMVEFYADWCGVCRALAPTINEVADLLVGKVRVVQANTDDLPEIAKKYKVESIPDLRVFVDGTERARVTAADRASAYVEELKKWFSDASPDSRE